MRVLVVAAEASGDMLAAAVVRALKVMRPDVELFGMAGPLMREAGVEAVRRAEEISVMGIAEVLPALPRIFGCLRDLARAAEQRRPEVALLVDSPDFNLRLAARLKRLGVPVVDFVGPTVWAWREGRVKIVRRYVDRMLCVLPFEEPFYRERGVLARYVGHPLLDAPAPRPVQGLDRARPVLALLPGSRRMEIRRILPVVAEAARQLVAERPAMQLVLPVAPTLSDEDVRAQLGGLPVTLVRGRAWDALAAADAAVVTSGTATLEAALVGRPFAVVYRASALSWMVGKMMVRVKHVALPNLIAGRELVPELLQGAMTADAIAAWTRRLLDDAALRERMVAELGEVREKMGPGGCAQRVAEEVALLAAERRAAA